jgi:hypothetical protein
MAETKVSKIAAEAHETFGLKIPAILEARTDGDVAVILRAERRTLIATGHKDHLAIADEAERFVRARHLHQGAYDAPR